VKLCHAHIIIVPGRLRRRFQLVPRTFIFCLAPLEQTGNSNYNRPSTAASGKLEAPVGCDGPGNSSHQRGLLEAERQ
jgi:hypothetical protein